MKSEAQQKSDRLDLVVKLREADNKTFREIGEAIGCGSTRAQELYRKAKRLRESKLSSPLFGLSVRAANCCATLNLTNREDIERAIKDGRLHPNSKTRCRNYGWKTHNEIHEWLGLPETTNK